MTNKTQKQIAEECMKKAREQLNEYKKTKNKSLLNFVYSNVGFAIYSKIEASNEVQKLKSYGVDVSKIHKWKLKVKDGKVKANEESFGFSQTNK